MSESAVSEDTEFELPPDPNEPFYGTVATGTVTEANDHVVLADVGEAGTAKVNRHEFADVPSAGTELSLLLEEMGEDGQWIASSWKATALGTWNRIHQLAREKATIEGPVVSANDGGLIVDIGVRGFCPASQVDLHRVDDFADYVGKIFAFQVTDFDRRRGDAILSRRNLLEADAAERGAELAKELEVGQIRTGVVRSLKPYGAFVDLGGIEGLLHNSNLAWARINHPREVLAVGDQVEVKILDLDLDANRIGLGRKQLEADPWEGITERVEIGSDVTGKVVSLTRFGAFVEILPGVEGLIHNSELSWTDRSLTAKKKFSEGDAVTARVVEVDPDQQRVGLSLRALETNPWQGFAEAHEVGQTIAGKVVRFADFGVFVELAEGIDGLLHVGDISWTERVDDPRKHFEIGQAVELKLLELDVDRHRAGLGLKQLTSDPWTHAAEIAQVGSKIEVEITRLAPFGAFAKITEGVEGLIHISELREERVEDASEVVSPGKTVEVLVMEFDRKRKRIGLSMKRDELEVDMSGAVEEYSDSDEATTSLGDLFGHSE